MRRLLALVGILGLLAAPATARAVRAVPVSPAPLDIPAAFTLTPDGSQIVYGERFTGRVRLLNPATGSTRTLFTVSRVAGTGEQGLLGLAVHPTWPADGRVWAFVTRNVAAGVRNQLVRIAADGSGMTVLRTLPAATRHNGGRIMFGPDRRLYVVMGDNGDPASSQRLDAFTGKVHRLLPGGAVPADNPVAGSSVIAYGIRNSFGFTFDFRTGLLWETENGPACNDEINLIDPARRRNYGWGPLATCATPPAPPLNTNRDGPSPVLPERLYTPVTAPTGAAFCRRCGLDAWGRLFVGEFNTRQIDRVTLTADRTGIAAQAAVYTHPDTVLSVETPPDGGPIYFSTRFNIFRLRP